MPHVAQYTFLFRTNTSAVLLSSPMHNSILRQTDPFFPMIDKKTEHFPIRKHVLAPFMEMLASTAGLSLKNSPTFSGKRGEIPQKSPIFYFITPATRSKQPRKIGNTPQIHSHQDHFKQNTSSIKQKPAEFTKNISHIAHSFHSTNTKHPCISSFMGESFALRPKIIIFADISEQRSREAVLVPLTTRTL